MAVKKNDFIEIEFTGVVDGKIFDTNIKKEAEKIDLKTSKSKDFDSAQKSEEISDIEEVPLIVCVGEGMLVKGFDNALEGKELDKEYKIKLSPEESFGKRNKDLIKIIPLKVFKEKNINPYPGLVLNLDSLLARIVTVSGGRVITDFNNPLAGKEVEYTFKIKRIITDDKEKINALQDFFFKKRFEFSLENKKVTFKDKNIKPVIEMFKDKFKEATGLEFKVEENSKEEKKPTEKNQEEKKNKEKNNSI